MVEVSEVWRNKLHIKSGSYESKDLVKSVRDGGLNFSRDQITELDLTVSDKNLEFFRTGVFNRNSVITYDTQRYVINSVSIDQDTSGAKVSVSAMSRVVHNLKKQKGAKSWGKISMSQFIRDVGGKAGASGYKVQNFKDRKQISRQKASDGSQEETSWDVMQRLANEYGAWCWEAFGIIYFGKPTWFAKNYRQLYVIEWYSESNYSAQLKSMPSYSNSESSDPRESLSINLLSRDADNIRPGDMFRLDGQMGSANGQWIVTDLDIPFTQNPDIQINLKRPIDPPPQQSAV